MKIISTLKYALLTIHVALLCWICFISDQALRLLLVWAGWQGGAIRSLQFALLALEMIGVLVASAFLDRHLGRAKCLADLVCRAANAIAFMLAALGALAAIPSAAGLGSWLLPVMALTAGAAWFLCRVLLGLHKKRPSAEPKRNI